uniref:Uncharacterized protein n=1 Tax=Plectus sambesii TaxID=2011161 RepID=A0A914UTL3_9BILA
MSTPDCPLLPSSGFDRRPLPTMSLEGRSGMALEAGWQCDYKLSLRSPSAPPPRRNKNQSNGRQHRRPPGTCTKRPCLSTQIARAYIIAFNHNVANYIFGHTPRLTAPREGRRISTPAIHRFRPVHFHDQCSCNQLTNRRTRTAQPTAMFYLSEITTATTPTTPIVAIACSWLPTNNIYS